MSESPSPKGAHLVEAKPLTFVDHVVNIFHLVIKELRSIRADPTMLILVVYAFSISVNTVATGAVTEATNLSVGIVDLWRDIAAIALIALIFLAISLALLRKQEA